MIFPVNPERDRFSLRPWTRYNNFMIMDEDDWVREMVIMSWVESYFKDCFDTVKEIWIMYRLDSDMENIREKISFCILI